MSNSPVNPFANPADMHKKDLLAIINLLKLKKIKKQYGCFVDFIFSVMVRKGNLMPLAGEFIYVISSNVYSSP